MSSSKLYSQTSRDETHVSLYGAKKTLSPRARSVTKLPETEFQKMVKLMSSVSPRKPSPLERLLLVEEEQMASGEPPIYESIKRFNEWKERKNQSVEIEVHGRIRRQKKSQ